MSISSIISSATGRIGSLFKRSAGTTAAAATATGTAVASGGSNVLKYGIQGAGVAGIAMCLYDAHKEGKRWKEIYVKKKNIDAARYWYDNSRNLHNTSNINAKMKDKLFDWETKNNLRGFINAPIGYLRGFFGMLATDVVPLAVSAAALTGKKLAGGALALYAMYGFGKNVLGIGVNPGEYTDKIV